MFKLDDVVFEFVEMHFITLKFGISFFVTFPVILQLSRD